MKRIFTPVQKKTVLLVADEQITLPIYREKLLGHAYKVEVVGRDDSVMQRLGASAIDLVLLDLCLPGMNTVEVLKNIRSEFASLPIVALSNPYLTNLARAAAEAGANKCVTRTEITPIQLVELVHALIAPGQAVHDSQIRTVLRDELVGNLLNSAPEILAKLRAGHQNFARTEEEDLRQAELSGMHHQIHALAGAGLLGLPKISQMANALEALFLELQAKPRKITPSVVRTIAQAVDALAWLLDQATHAPVEEAAAARILVVDDEVISRETICSALAKADLEATSLDDSFAAQQALEKEHFDLVFLDVEMPGQNGFELCVKIREMLTNRTTPVVFVTAHSDFASRAQSALSGGNDFIAKPFLSVELVVKTLTRLFKENPRPAIAAAGQSSIAMPVELPEAPLLVPALQ